MLNSKQKVLTIKTDYDDNVINLQISDTGCGMDPKTKEHIFEPFLQQKPIQEQSKLQAYQAVPDWD